MDVKRERQDRSDGDQEYGESEVHRGSPVPGREPDETGWVDRAQAARR